MLNHNNYKVLYVEDEKDIFSTTMKFLKKFLGDNVEGALNGEDGLEKFKQNNYDMVITDLKMPKLNGHEMLKQMREYKPDVKVMIITASDSHMDYSKSKSDSYMIKPIEFSTFLIEIKKVLEILEKEEIGSN